MHFFCTTVNSFDNFNIFVLDLIYFINAYFHTRFNLLNRFIIFVLDLIYFEYQSSFDDLWFDIIEILVIFCCVSGAGFLSPETNLLPKWRILDDVDFSQILHVQWFYFSWITPLEHSSKLAPILESSNKEQNKIENWNLQIFLDVACNEVVLMRNEMTWIYKPCMYGFPLKTR